MVDLEKAYYKVENLQAAMVNLVESDTLYLVGDIIDGWRLKRRFFWEQSHNDVIQKLLRKARKGTEVIYVPGNHDEALRDYVDMQFGGVTVLREAMHETADGKRFLILHGDEFDGITRYAKWLALLGDWGYNLMLSINNKYNWIRKKFGFPYWSLSAYLKERVKNAVEFVSNFETAVAAEAKKRDVDGVICGHIHKAEMRDIDGVLYCNDGDWVESCTALVEYPDGRLEILNWADYRAVSRFDFSVPKSADEPPREKAAQSDGVPPSLPTPIPTPTGA
ncbi:MAG: metallophosphoesterase [Pseudomonadota bacterium]